MANLDPLHVQLADIQLWQGFGILHGRTPSRFRHKELIDHVIRTLSPFLGRLIGLEPAFVVCDKFARYD